MKLNIVTILLFAVLLTTGISTKSNAQHCGHRYGYWAPEHACATKCSDHHGCWGGWGRGWRYGYGHCASGCTQEMRQHAIDDSISYAKYRDDVKAAHAKYEEGDKIMKDAHHGSCGHGSCGHGCGHGYYGGWWGGWRYNRYYYRGAGY